METGWSLIFDRNFLRGKPWNKVNSDAAAVETDQRVVRKKTEQKKNMLKLK